MATEFELKYRATAEQLELIRGAYAGGYTDIPMSTTYYDTADGALSARRWTLRHRREGDEEVCTLKTPAPGGARGEWELRCGHIGQALERLARASGEGLLLTLRAEDLVVACGARFHRQAKLLVFPEFTAELALDSGVLLGGGREAAFAEAELELKSGSREALVAFGGEFQARFGLEIQPMSKFARAKALAQEG